PGYRSRRRSRNRNHRRACLIATLPLICHPGRSISPLCHPDRSERKRAQWRDLVWSSCPHPRHLRTTSPTLSSRPERAKAGAVEGPGVVFLSASAPPQNHISPLCHPDPCVPPPVIPTGASESERSGGI